MHEDGFSLVEVLIASTITLFIVGSAMSLVSTVARTYSYELNDAAAQQESRLALEWIKRTISPAGSNPYSITTSACPLTGTIFAAIRPDPDGDGLDDDIRVQADINPPNGVLLGRAFGDCAEEGEDVTIAYDPETRALTRRDVALDRSPLPVTDAIFTGLRFRYFSASRVETRTPASIRFVQVTLAAESRSRNPYTGRPRVFSTDSEIRLRLR
jgi:hypothetical protein